MSEIIKTWTQWLNNSRFSHLSELQKQQTLLWLELVRDKILDRANLKAGDTVIDIGTGTGLLLWGIYERLKNTDSKIIASDAFADCVEECRKIAAQCGIENEITFLQADAANTTLPENSVDVVVMRSVLVHILDKPSVINEFFRILKPSGGRLSVFEPIMSQNTRFYQLITPENFDNFDLLKEIEDKMMSDENDPLMNFNEKSLKQNFADAGFKNIDFDIVTQNSTYQVQKEAVDPWFNTPPSPGNPTVKEKYLKFLSEKEVDNFIEKIKIELDGKVITINSPTVFITAEK